jgi:ribosomal protein L28
MNRALSSIAISIVCFTCGTALAGVTAITDAGAKNFGSFLAHIAICERESFIPVGTLGDLMSTSKKGLTEGAWEKTKSQFQQSLHDKKLYSIARDQWLPFRINAKDCRSIEKAIPTLKDAVIRFGK